MSCKKDIVVGEKGRGGGRPLDLCVSQVDNAVVGVSLDIYFRSPLQNNQKQRKILIQWQKNARRIGGGKCLAALILNLVRVARRTHRKLKHLLHIPQEPENNF